MDRSAASPDQLAARLDRKLAPVRELRIRARVLEEQIDQLGAAVLYELMAHVLRRRSGEGTTPDWLREGLHALLAGCAGEPLSYERRAELYARASAAHDELIMGLLRSHEARRDAAGALEHPHLELRDVPLGRRRSLARRRDPLLLEKLARDPDPTVIANLLANPRTTEADVVRMAALRPVASSTLLEIARAPRWGRQSRVRCALAQNPDCPVDLALQQLHALPRGDLREIAQNPALHPELRAHAQHELQRRGRAGD